MAIAGLLSDDDIVTCAPHKDTNSTSKQQQSERSPHSLRLDNQRVAYSFCNLHSIPEDDVACEYRLVVRDEPLESESKKTNSARSIQFHTLRKERLAQALATQPMMEVAVCQGDTKTAVHAEEPCVFGKKRNQAWNSAQFDGLFQVLQDDECLENDENTDAESSSSSSSGILMLEINIDD